MTVDVDENALREKNRRLKMAAAQSGEIHMIIIYGTPPPQTNTTESITSGIAIPKTDPDMHSKNPF